MKNITICLTVVLGLNAAATYADSLVQFYDVPSPEWDAALQDAGKVGKGTTDFGTDPDYGLTGFDGPLTSTGAGPVSTGVVLENLLIDAQGPSDSTSLVAVGPSAGFGNPSNAILANYFTDSLDIWINEPTKTAMSINLLTMLGGPTVELAVYDTNDNLLDVATVLAPPTGTETGILVTGAFIGRVNIFDPADGAEGFMDVTVYNVPEPATWALLAVSLLGAFRRRTELR